MSVMPFNLDDMLVVAITSRALFDLHESDQVYKEDGLDTYRAHQREREDVPLDPGTAFPLVRGLLAINDRAGEQMAEVVILSRNDGDSGLRLMNSIEHHKLPITGAAFRGGEDPWAYLRAFRCDLFLSADRPDVQEAWRQRVPSALVLDPPERRDAPAEEIEQVRIAFDGDAVLFDGESERYFKEHGLEAFLAREAELADVPMDPGPFEPFEQPVAAAKTRPAHLALENLQLVTKDHELGIALQVIGGASDKLDEAAQQQVHERVEHGRNLPGERGPILRTRWLRR